MTHDLELLIPINSKINYNQKHFYLMKNDIGKLI